MPLATRHKVLYGCEVWVLEGLKVVTEFVPGTFAPAPHAHVYVCPNEEIAKTVVEAIKPVADKAMLEDINREHDRQG